MAKYEVADKHKVTTAFTLSRFRAVAAKICDGGAVNTSTHEEFLRLVIALLEDQTIVFAPEEDIPF